MAQAGGNKKRRSENRKRQSTRYWSQTWPAHKLRNILRHNTVEAAKAWAQEKGVIANVDALARRYRAHRAA